MTGLCTGDTGRTGGCNSDVEAGNGEKGSLCRMAGPRVWMDRDKAKDRVALTLTYCDVLQAGLWGEDLRGKEDNTDIERWRWRRMAVLPSGGLRVINESLMILRK